MRPIYRMRRRFAAHIDRAAVAEYQIERLLGAMSPECLRGVLAELLRDDAPLSCGELDLGGFEAEQSAEAAE